MHVNFSLNTFLPLYIIWSCHGPVVRTLDSQTRGRGYIPVRGKNLGSNVNFLVTLGHVS